MPETVYLHVYDLSQGIAAAMSPALLGKQIMGVWHTAIVVGGVEYYYGGAVQQAPAGCTPFGQPLDVVPLGNTEVPEDIRQELISDLASGEWRPECYDLFRHNCNHFANELSLMLTGQGIPEHIVMLPEEVLSTPFGQMIAPMLVGPGSLQATLGNVRQEMPPPALAAPSPAAPAGTSLLGASTSASVTNAGLPANSVPAQADKAMRRGPGDREGGRNSGPALEAAHHALEIATAAAALEEAAEVEGLTAPEDFAGAPKALHPSRIVSSEQPSTGGSEKRTLGPDAGASQGGQGSLPQEEGGLEAVDGKRMEGTVPAGQKQGMSSGGTRKEGVEAEGAAQNGQAGGSGAGKGQGGRGDSGGSQDKAQFEAAVRAEFAALMAVGSMSANQAAILALQRVRARSIPGASVPA